MSGMVKHHQGRDGTRNQSEDQNDLFHGVELLCLLKIERKVVFKSSLVVILSSDFGPLA